MSAYIKSIDSNHMVSVGDEGFFNEPDNANWLYQGTLGVDTVALTNISTYDSPCQPEIVFAEVLVQDRLWHVPYVPGEQRASTSSRDLTLTTFAARLWRTYHGYHQWQYRRDLSSC